MWTLLGNTKLVGNEWVFFVDGSAKFSANSPPMNELLERAEKLSSQVKEMKEKEAKIQRVPWTTETPAWRLLNHFPRITDPWIPWKLIH